MDIIEAIRNKRAVRQFTAEPLPDEVVEAILNAGRRAQSSKNSQPWQFVAVRDKTTLKALSQCGQYAGHLAGAALAVALVGPKESVFDLGQAAAYMQLAALHYGVGSCLASMWEPDKARQILGIPDEWQFDIALSFGYPVEAAPARKNVRGRKDLAELVRWEKWGEVE